MFEPSDRPRVFGLAPGIDFPAALVAGLTGRMAGQPPEAMARVELIVNTERMGRRLRQLFDAGPATLLPRIRMITDLGLLAPDVVLPAPAAPLRRRLELISLVAKLLDQQPDLAPRASLYDLSDSLAKLMDEMQGEGVDADAIAGLDVSDQSGHWQRAQQFIRIAQDYVDSSDNPPDPETRQRALVEALIARWQASPPQHPVIVAGSTGSRGTSALLMQAVARLPQGALVLPGFDFDMPTGVWASLNEQLLSEDHPQYRFHNLMNRAGLHRHDILPWHDTVPPSAARNALVSLSLRPAPVTDAWLNEGGRLTDLARATEKMTLVQADSPRAEALAIAMRLRQAAEDGQTAALITPDRMLTRQVTAALDRWDILPDDSAGLPLQLSPPGRFLRHVADLFARRLEADGLLTLLKHPLTHSGAGRALHQLNTQRLELRIRDKGLPYPEADSLVALATAMARKDEDAAPLTEWATWVARQMTGKLTATEQPLADWVARHRMLAESLAAGPDGADADAGELWRKNAGQQALQVMEDLERHAPFGGHLSARDYADLLGALLSEKEVRDRDAPRAGIMIWGTLEARVQGADLVILGGLNDGTWPEAPKPDPWLNRALRHQAGLLLPERRIGLSAHDYQQAIAAPEVWLTRAIRSDDAETVPSRWLNRLGNLLGGLTQGGPDARSAMIARGDIWLARARRLEAVARVDPAPRPSPRPPTAARTRSLSVTEIKRLIRDPYAIYAKHTLRLRMLGALSQEPDALIRGTVLHEIMERFVKDLSRDPALLTRDHLMQVADTVLAREVPWPTARALWRARIDRVADWFVIREIERQALGTPVAFERQARGDLTLPGIGFHLKGYADRIDRTENGDALLYDYKTGTPPAKSEQLKFDKQLLIEAAMIEEGAFSEVGPAHVARAVFIGLGSKPVEVPAPLDEESPREVLAELHALLSAYLDPDQGYTSRRMVKTDDFAGDYDQLARFGEWDGTDAPKPEDLT